MQAKLVKLPRNIKRAIMLASDAVAIPLAYWASFNLRLDFGYSTLNSNDLLVLAGTLILTCILFTRIGLYRAVLRYMGMEAGWTVAKGALGSTLIMLSIAFLANSPLPRSVPFIYFLILLLFVGGVRFLARQMLHSLEKFKRRPVAIYGAGAAGTQALMSLLKSPEYKPVLFVDDDPKVQGRVYCGVEVVSRDEFLKRVDHMNIKDLLLAIPSVSRRQRKEIIESMSHLPIHVQTIPGMADLVSGKARIEEIKDVDIEDLLGRNPVDPDDNLMHANIRGRVVMVTGAGGSIGSELCRQIVKLNPKMLLLFEQSEFALYQIERELKTEYHEEKSDIKIVPALGSVLDKSLLKSFVATFGVQTLFHAAAYKHVPIVEYNVVAGIRNNVFGTLNVAEIANECCIENCILISTDKAVRPTNVMGASKRIAELIFQAMEQRSKTRFSMVRFGNVLGSSGSVIPLFRQQIENGGPVTVTHPDIIRYFMTIREAAELVIQAGAMSKGGEVFVLDMGEPVKISDLAHKMISLMGYSILNDKGEGDIEIVYSGLRPGEKLFEELLIGENVTPTQHPQVMRASETYLEWSKLECFLKDLALYCNRNDCDTIRGLLISCPLDFRPANDIEDMLWLSEKKNFTPRSEVLEAI
ncbi:MAG: hypothetical protein CMK83_08115 [Pseudomonadales bacterium]|nr:hypothetical protein [Pseudomonadales bacterium]|tara:strand:- start:44 stop:1963 length:1920 start_codon:yes stop_codon:yes gene_type:complete